MRNNRSFISSLLVNLMIILQIDVIAQQTNTNSQNKPIEIHGKLDFLSQIQKDFLKLKLFIWNNKIKGGFGYENINDNSVAYTGAYIKSNFKSKILDDLVLGGYYDNKTKTVINGQIKKEYYIDYEFQGDLFFKNGIGIGGGYVNKNLLSTEISFFKVSFRNVIYSKINYTIAIQMQFIGSKKYLGGLGAIYSKSFFAGGCYDGEQWRADFGYIYPQCGKLCPALEILYVDNSIGDFNGAKYFFVNGTLDYQGGFLSNEARLGRALGPTGIVFTNPLGFLNPNTWNRIHNTWEYGKLLDFRIIYYPNSNQKYSLESELILFPANLDRNTNIFDNIFLGYSFIEQTYLTKHILTLGYFGKIFAFNKEKLPLLLSSSGGIDLISKTFNGTVGLILKY